MHREFCRSRFRRKCSLNQQCRNWFDQFIIYTFWCFPDRQTRQKSINVCWFGWLYYFVGIGFCGFFSKMAGNPGTGFFILIYRVTRYRSGGCNLGFYIRNFSKSLTRRRSGIWIFGTLDSCSSNSIHDSFFVFDNWRRNRISDFYRHDGFSINICHFYDARN